MKKMLLAFSLCLMGILPVAAYAQEPGDISVFGGYAHTWVTQRNHAWNASIAGNLTKHLALVADFSGNYHSDSYADPYYQGENHQQNHTFLFGPRYLYTINKRWTPFAHVLFGLERETSKGWYRLGSTTNSYGPNSFNYFAAAFGVGLDIKINNRISVRPIQFDGVGITDDVFSPFWGYYLRTSFGAVIRLR